MDIAPYYDDVEYIQRPKLVQDYEITKPKLKKTSDMHPYLMVTPSKVDFRRPVRTYMISHFIMHFRMRILHN